MEVILLGAILVKYDTIVSTFRNLDPFLNIERNSGCFYYNVIIVLKSLYVLYAMINAIPKLWMVLFTGFSKAYLIYMRPELAFSAYLTAFFHFIDMNVAEMGVTSMLAITCNSFEFLLDINVLFCTLYYAAQTYKREIHKLVIIICFSLSIGSYVNNIESAETFKFGVYYLLVMMCLATVFPLLPNRKKYGHRLKFYYMLLIVWIAYKGGLHSTNERLSAIQYGSNNVCNVTSNIYESRKCGLNETLESLHLDDILIYDKLRKVDLKVKNLTPVMKDEKKSLSNKKEASWKYGFIPDKICSMNLDNSEENLETEMKGSTDGTTNLERELIGTADSVKTSITDDKKVDSTEQENSESEIKERKDGTTNPAVGHIESAEYDKASIGDMKVDNTDQENSETYIKERTDKTTNQEIGHIEASEYDRESMTDMKVDSTEQKSLKTEIMERTDGTANKEIELIEARENDKASMTENFKEILSFGDEKNALEEDYTNLRQKIFEEGIEHWTDNTFEDEIVSANLFQMIKTNGYEEHMDDQSDKTENFPETETSVDDIDYTIEKRLGTFERINNRIILQHEIAYKSLKFKNSDKSEQQSHQNYEFVDRIQTIDDSESEETLTHTKAEIKETKFQTTETRVLGEKDAITQVVPAEAFMDETTEAKAPETRVLELAESGVSGESRFHSTHVSKTEENYLPSENGNTTANECKLTAVNPQNSLLKNTEKRNLEAQETELVSTTIMGEIDAERAKALSNPNQVDDIQNKLAVSKESDENKIDLSETAQDFGSIEYLRIKSKETCKSQIQEHFMETKVTEVSEMTEAEYSEPIVSTTNGCEKEFALARYPRGTDYEICKPIPSANNHEISKDSDSSASKFETLKTEKAKTINLQTPENTGKTDLKYAEENTDSTERVVSSNTLYSYFPKVGDDKLRESGVNEILATETTENESKVFLNGEKTTLQTTISYQTSEREKRDPGENDLPSYSNETSAIKLKPVHRYKSKKTEAGEIRDTETETNENRSGSKKFSDPNAEEIKITSASSPLKNKLESAKKDEAESINIDIKSQANEIDSMENNKGKYSTSEPVLPGNHESEASGIRASAPKENEAPYSGTTKIQTRNVYSSHIIEPKSKIEYNSDASDSKDDRNVGTKELEPTEKNNPKERQMEVIKVASQKESELKFTKSKENENAFTESSELKSTKSNLPSTVQPKPIQDQETSDSIQNEHRYMDSHLRTPTFEETNASYSSTREIATIQVMDSKKSQLLTKSSETRETKDTYTGGTKLKATRNDLLFRKPSQRDYSIKSELQFNEVSDPSEEEVSNASNFDARDIKPIKLADLTENQLKHATTRHAGDSLTGATIFHATKNVPRTIEPKQNEEQEVSHRSTKENKISKAYPSGEIQPIEVMVPENSSSKSSKAGETNDAFKGDAERLDTKTDVSPTFQGKPTEQGEVGDSIANEPNKVSPHQKNELEATTGSYFVATEIEPVKGTGPKDSQFKPTKSGDVEISKPGSTIDSEDIQTKSNKVEELEVNKFEITESTKDNFIDVSKELSISVETSEYDYSNKVNDGEEIGYKETKIDNFGVSEYISNSTYIESRKVSDVSEIKESKGDVGELEKQAKDVNPSSKTESKENTFQSNGPTVASIPRELILRKVTNHKVNEFDLSEASNVRANENNLKDGNGELIEPKIEIKHLDKDNENNKAYKREMIDINETEESQTEKETEVIEGGNSEIREIEYQEMENSKRDIEHPLTASKESEISSSNTKAELLMSKSDEVPVIGSDPKETEDAKFTKTETFRVDVESSEKILSEGNVSPHRLDSADIEMSKIHGIKVLGATEIIPEIPDIYKTAAIFQGDQAEETTETKSEVQKSGINIAETAGPEVLQSAENDNIATSDIKK